MDWEKDSQGTGILPKKLFLDAMFELTDMWTANIDADEYCGFLEELFQCVSVTQPDGRHLWKVRARVWRACGARVWRARGVARATVLRHSSHTHRGPPAPIPFWLPEPTPPAAPARECSTRARARERDGSPRARTARRQVVEQIDFGGFEMPDDEGEEEEEDPDDPGVIEQLRHEAHSVR
eukprot:944653-Prymnesium_polylepis.2